MATARVLLVEDECLIRLAAAEALQDAGFEVVEAQDGEGAAKLLDGAGRFDLLFTDVQMPGTLDGIDVATHVRHRHPAIPVLVVSGYAADLTHRLGGLLPPVVFINKPYDLQEIVTVLSRMIGRPRPL